MYNMYDTPRFVELRLLIDKMADQCSMSICHVDIGFDHGSVFVTPPFLQAQCNWQFAGIDLEFKRRTLVFPLHYHINAFWFSDSIFIRVIPKYGIK